MLFIVIFIITGCASVAGERMQPITVKTVYETEEVAGVGCTLTNNTGSWFLTTPASISVHKSTGDLAIDCKKEIYVGNQTLISKSNGAVWGNILIGGGIGYIIDRNTGAGFDYPTTITVMLRKLTETKNLGTLNVLGREDIILQSKTVSSKWKMENGNKVI